MGLAFRVGTPGCVGSPSPFGVGWRWGAARGLVGLRFGDPNGSRLGLLIGPTVFLGTVTDVRAFLGVRFEAPLARREHHPHLFHPWRSPPPSPTTPVSRSFPKWRPCHKRGLASAHVS